MTKLKETTDKNEALLLFRQHTREELCKVLEFSDKAFKDCVHGFMNENLKELKRISVNVMEEKRYIKQMRRMGTIGVTRLEESIAVDKGLYYNQGNDFAGEIVFSIRRMNDACLEHVDNHFNPLDDIQKEELRRASDEVDLFLRKVMDSIRNNDYHRMYDILQYSLVLYSNLTLLKKGELKRIQGQSGSTKLSMLYLSILQETQNIVQFAANMLKVSRKFQV
jgi:Na+/phosphate symporter